MRLCVDIQGEAAESLRGWARRDRQLDVARELRAPLARAEPGRRPDRRTDLLRDVSRAATRRRAARLVSSHRPNRSPCPRLHIAVPTLSTEPSAARF